MSALESDVVSSAERWLAVHRLLDAVDERGDGEGR
jgi:hypothetical protein